MEKVENVIIVGSGPAGYTAALYAARGNLNPLVIEGFAWGGLLQNTTDVENFPGFAKGIDGPALMQEMRDQAERFGARLVPTMADGFIWGKDGAPHTVIVEGEHLLAKSVVLATGAEHRHLDIDGEQALSGRGVSWCATCDAAFFKDQPVVVVGGGDSAMEEAIFAAKYASQVDVLHRSENFRASEIMLQRARDTANITVHTNWQPLEFVANENGALAGVLAQHTTDQKQHLFQGNGAFIAIGHLPNSQLLDGIDKDEDGYVTTNGLTTDTNVAGVFACGDLVDRLYRQAITAAGSGCKAALDVEKYLQTLA